MAAPEFAEGTFTREPGFELAEWWAEAQRRFEDSLFTATAHLRATALGIERLARLSPRGRGAARSAAAPGPDGWTELHMAVENSDHGARELLSVGPEIEVIGPSSLRQRMASLAAVICQLNQGEYR
jgi:predicted DNA-binding transcriptional regulator YafY